MAQAARTLQLGPTAANDNRPPQSRGDVWHHLITGLKAIDPGFAVFAAERRLSGQDVYEFCGQVRAAALSIGLC